MKMRFTEKGDLEILMENKLEKEIFPCIERDAKSMGEEWLSDSLGPDFDEPWFGHWQEWIQPEVQEQFNRQIMSLRQFAQLKNDILYIPQSHVEQWYGAVNQARLALETIFHFSEEDLPEDREELITKIEQWPDEKQGGYQRYHFYAWFQEILLEGLMHFSNWDSSEEDEEPENGLSFS